MATVTASLATAGAPVKMNYEGATTLRVLYVGSANTLSDIIMLCKLPNGAMVTALTGVFGTGNADTVMKLGWRGVNSSTTAEAAFGTHTTSSTDATTNFALHTEDLGPVHISFTDSIGNNYALVYATASVGSFSDTYTIDIALTYTVDHFEGTGA